MFGPCFQRRIAILVVSLPLVGLPLAVWSPNPVAATELEAISIGLIPADAAFYGAMLRNREQIEIIARSNAWQRLLAMPVVRQGMATLQGKLEEEDPQAVQIRQILDNPQVQDLLAMLADLFSRDVFCYGNPAVADAIKLIQQVSNAANYGGAALEVLEHGNNLSDGERRGKAALYALAKHLDLMKLPTMIAGFKIEDEDRAIINLGKLEGILGFATMIQPQLAGSVQRQQVCDNPFLTVTLSGEMIPWSEIPLDELRRLEATAGDVDKIVEKITGLQLIVAIGMHKGYLMTAVTDSLDELVRLGEGDSLLSRPEMEPLKQHAERPLIGIGYTSQEFVRRISLAAEDLDALLELGDAMLPQIELDASLKDQIRTDAKTLADEIKRLLPAPGAAVSFSFMTAGGVESFHYNWTENRWLDGSKPLDLLRHVGGDPLLAFVCRGNFGVEQYEQITHWIEVLHGYFERLALPQMDEDDRNQYERYAEQIGPFCQRFHQINRKSLLPALAGESALVIDAKLMSRQFCKDMPPANQPMPMAEPALVAGIADRGLMEEAYEGYQAALDEMVETLKRLTNDGKIPEDYQIPWPSFREIDGASVLFYDLPEQWGVDRQIVPNAALIDEVAAVSASESHTRRLLEGSSLAAGGVLAAADRPRAAAVVFDWAGTVRALAPWIRQVAGKATVENLQVDKDDPKVKEVLLQVDTVLEVLQTIGRCTMECAFEKGALVTHSFMEIRDLE